MRWIVFFGAVCVVGCQCDKRGNRVQQGAPPPQHATEQQSPTEAPHDRGTWAEHTPSALQRILDEAQTRAAQESKCVLLEFVAPWCADCREAERLLQEPEVNRALDQHFVRVPINVGRFDRHRDLIARYSVRSIATFIVIDRHGRPQKRRTLEPVSGDERITAKELASWLRESASSH